MISNASPLIFFGKLNKLELLIKLFDKIEIAESVYQEVVEQGENKHEVESIKEFINRRMIIIEKLDNKSKEQSDFIKKGFRLQQGEADTIALALQKSTKKTLIDEKPARKAAELYGLLPIGTLGVILLAYKKEIITENELNNIIEKLINDNFRIGAEVLNEFWKLFDMVKKKKRK